MGDCSQVCFSMRVRQRQVSHLSLLFISIVICTPAAAGQTSCGRSCHSKLPSDLKPWCLLAAAAAALLIRVSAVKRYFLNGLSTCTAALRRQCCCS